MLEDPPEEFDRSEIVCRHCSMVIKWVPERRQWIKADDLARSAFCGQGPLGARAHEPLVTVPITTDLEAVSRWLDA